MGFGTAILFVLVLGWLVLGPQRLFTMLASVARAKAQFAEATRGLKSQLSAELDPAPQTRHERAAPTSPPKPKPGFR